MFSLDPKLEALLKLNLKRVLVVESNLAHGRVLVGMLRVLGADTIYVEADADRALQLMADFEPQIVFAEVKGEALDGAGLITRMRRSDLKCRKAPVILLTANEAPDTLKMARDCGGDELMQKPFASGDLLNRLNHVFTKSRPWIEAIMYVGPDRRRFNSGSGPTDRTPETMSDGMKRLEQGIRILRAARHQFATDPKQATRAILAQLEVMVPACKSIPDPSFTAAVGEIFRLYKAGELSTDALTGPVNSLSKLFHIDDHGRKAKAA